MKQKIILLCVLILGIITFLIIKPNPKVIKENGNENSNNLISVLVDGVEQSAFPSKGSAEYQSTSCTNGEHAEWDEANWKLSIQDISASTRCVVSFVTGGHNVYVTVSGGSVDNAPKSVPHNGNVTFTVASSNNNYVFSSVKCSGANSYTWANNILSVNGVTADAYCDVVFSRPTYTVYFNVVGGYTADNYLTVVRGGGNSTTFGAIPGYLVSGTKITCDSGITGKISGDRIVLSNVQSSGDCTITCAKDSSNYLPGGGVYNIGDEVSYANLAWSVLKNESDKVTLILKGNATYSGNTKGTGIFGSGVTYTSSSARSYLVDIWLEQDSQKYLRNAINSEGLEYQDSSNGFIRLPYASEVSQKIPNASGTNFWTMDNDDAGHVYYGQPSGYLTEGKGTDNKYYYEYYTLATNTNLTYQNVPGTAKSSGYYSATCQQVKSGALDNSSNPYKFSYCDVSSGPILNKWFYKSSGSNPYCNGSSCNVSCAGGSEGGYCSSTCVNAVKTITGTWSQTTVNPYSGNQNNGSHSIGYVKWTQGSTKSGETKHSSATLTSLTLDNKTVGNNGMTNGLQAVSPSSSSARYNDTTPEEADIQGNVTAGTLTNIPEFYQGYSGTSCADTQKTSSFTEGKATIKGYTLQQNTAEIGYRPVIVVYKAN